MHEIPARPGGTLPEQLTASFPDAARRRGELLWETGGLEVGTRSADVFGGVAVGDGGAEPVLRLRPGRRVVVGCTCSSSTLEPCSHAWALVLAADAVGWGLSEYEEDAEEEDDDEPARDVWATRGRGVLPRRPERADWRSLLQTLDVTTAAELRERELRQKAAPEEREVWLVINTGETLAKQRLHLDCMERRLKEGGAWGAFKPVSCTVDEIVPARGGARESAVRTLLASLPTASLKRGGYGRGAVAQTGVFETLVLDGAFDRTWWEALLAEVHVGIASVSAAGKQILPAALDESPVWTDEVAVERAGNGRDWTITLRLKRDDGKLVNLDEPLVVLDSGLVIFKDTLAWMRPRPPKEFAWIAMLRQSPRITVPDAQLDAVIGKLLQLETAPYVRWSEEAVAAGRHWREESAAPQPILRLGRGVLTKGRGSVVAARVAFGYGTHVVEADEPREVLALGRYRHLLRRDTRGERELFERLLAHGGGAVSRRDEGAVTMPAEAMIGVIERLERDGWVIEIERARVRTPTVATAHVKSGIDWFELDGQWHFGREPVALPAILKAIADKSPFVELGDGSLGLLPSAWLERFSTLSAMGTVQDGKLRFAQNQIAALDLLLEEIPDVDADELFRSMREKMRRFAGVAPGDPAPSFHGELRPYQRDGVGWLRFLREFGFGGCLADDMGLGKTIQVLAALPEPGAAAGPSLVVVPRSLVYNWRAEAARFRPDLRVLDYDLCDRKAAETVCPTFDLVVITYGCLRRDAARLHKIAFDWVVLDEAQAIKNRLSQTARAARSLTAAHRLALSGTPVENRVDELVSIFEFLNPGMISASMFNRVKPRSGSESIVHAMLGKALRPFILRRTKEQVLRDLPQKTEQTLYCELDTAQRQRYDEIRKYYQAHLLDVAEREGLEEAKFHVLEALLRLRQAACHPALIDEAYADDGSAKLDALVEQLADVAGSGHKAIVFSQFTSLLGLVRARLGREGLASEYLDGQTRDRERRVRRFQEDAGVPVFLVSLKAGGVGLNLTAAGYCFLLDPWWNPAVEAQAIARAHRIGQTKPVFAYRLIARGTVEEKILELQAQKRGVADAIVGEDNASLAKMTLADLRFLLTP